MANCCSYANSKSAGEKQSLPLLCLVPRDGGASPHAGGSGSKPRPASANSLPSGFKLLDDEYLKKHFDLPQRALYLDPFRRPLITFPLGQETNNHFNLAKKTKINQQILDGFLDSSEAIAAPPSVFPYGKTESEKQKDAEDDEEIIYILQLPDLEYQCPVHNQIIKTPRFIWHSCKKEKKDNTGKLKRGGGPLNKPKPWLLSRHTDFDLLSQW